MAPRKSDPVAVLTQALKDAVHGEQAPDDPEALVKAVVAKPDKDILIAALMKKTGGRVVLQRGSDDVDEAQTVAFIKHLAATGSYDQPKFMGQRVRLLTEITKRALVGDPFYAAAGLQRMSLTADGINPASGVKYPGNDPDMMERIAFVASRVRVVDASDSDEVQPLVDRVTGKNKEPRKKVDAALDDYADAKREGDKKGEIATARRLLAMEAATSSVPFVVDGASEAVLDAVQAPPLAIVDPIEKMNGLLPAQFTHLVFRLRIPDAMMSPATVPQGQRSIEVFRWAQQDSARMSALLSNLGLM